MPVRANHRLVAGHPQRVAESIARLAVGSQQFGLANPVRPDSLEHVRRARFVRRLAVAAGADDQPIAVDGDGAPQKIAILGVCGDKFGLLAPVSPLPTKDISRAGSNAPLPVARRSNGRQIAGHGDTGTEPVVRLPLKRNEFAFLQPGRAGIPIDIGGA